MSKKNKETHTEVMPQYSQPFVWCWLPASCPSAEHSRCQSNRVLMWGFVWTEGAELTLGWKAQEEILVWFFPGWRMA